MQGQNDQEKIFREISCLKCFRFPVCYYYRAVVPVVSFDSEKLEKLQPFRAEDLAKICKLYAPDAVGP